MTNSALARAFAELNDEAAMTLIKNKIAAGIDPLSVVKELQAGMEIFGEQCKNGNFFISDLILAGDLFQQAMQLLEPRLKEQNSPQNGPRIVLGTVKGDIHNLGKDILAILLKASGFKVYDLGINVSPEVFVQHLKETGSGILGLSGLITPSFESMKATIQAVEAAGLREKVKVIIGGGVVSEIARHYCGADSYSTDAMQGLEWCRQAARGRYS